MRRAIIFLAAGALFTVSAALNTNHDPKTPGNPASHNVRISASAAYNFRSIKTNIRL